MIILLLLFILFVSLAAWQGGRLIRISRENQILKMYMVSMEEMYAMIQNQIMATRRYRHDLQKHIRTLEMLISSTHQDAETTKAMQDYLEKLRDDYKSSQERMQLKDELISSIMTLAEGKCQRAGISFEVNVQDSEYSGIDDVSLVAVIENLIENAIEACERVKDPEKKKIYFKMSQTDKEVSILCENTYQGSLDQNLKTTKIDKGNHGHGLDIVRSIARIYKGGCAIYEDPKQETFTVTVLLKTDKCLPEGEVSA